MAFGMKCVDGPLAGCGNVSGGIVNASREARKNCMNVYVRLADQCYRSKGYPLTHEPYCKGQVYSYGVDSLCTDENVPCCHND